MKLLNCITLKFQTDPSKKGAKLSVAFNNQRHSKTILVCSCCYQENKRKKFTNKRFKKSEEREKETKKDEKDF